MIKITKAVYLQDYIIKLEFSDGAYVDYDFAYLLDKKSSLTEVLKDKSYFKSYFLELGAICWRNGLELSPSSLYKKAEQNGILFGDKEVA